MISGFNSASAFHIEYGNNIVINRPVYGDLYLAGGNITINAPVYGDLIIAGGTIIINDTIASDILLLGGNVTFNGYVGDDIRCAGGNIRISKSVKDDVVIAGGKVTVDKTAVIGGMIASGGNITIDGDISGELKGAFGYLILNGNVLKNIDCRGKKITVNGTVGGEAIIAARDIIIGSGAAFNGDVKYWNKKESLDFRQSVKRGKAMLDPSLRIRSGQWYYLGAATVLGLLWYLGMALLMILIVQYLFSSTMKRAAETSFNHTLKSLGLGFLFFIAVPVAAIAAFVTIIGVPIGLLLIMGYVTLILLTTVIISVVASNWLNNRNKYNWNFWRIAFGAFGVFVLLKLVSLTPFIGWLVIIVMACIAFGAILLSIKWRTRQIATLTM